MSVFDATTVRWMVRMAIGPDKRAKFDENWDKTVSLRILWDNRYEDSPVTMQVTAKLPSWMESRTNHQSVDPEQLKFEANIVAYLNELNSYTFYHGNSAHAGEVRPLPTNFPILGPRFVHPSYLEGNLTNPGSAKVDPHVALIMPVNVIHPVYYTRTRKNLRRCPRCGEENVKNVHWNGWGATGHREVFGVRRPETALGYQLRCRTCQAAGGERAASHCFATTSPEFWAGWKFWEIPRELQNTSPTGIAITN